MKRLVALLVCIILCVGLFGCGDNTEEKNAEAHAALTKVINKEASFLLMSSAKNTSGEMSLDNCQYIRQNSTYVSFVAFHYLFCDFDRDGIDEMLVADAMLSDFLFFKYDADVVRAYDYRHIDMQGVDAGGSFITILDIFTGNSKAISRVSFVNDAMTVTYEAYMDVETDEYMLNGKAVDKETVEEYIDDWYAGMEKVTWTSLYKDPLLSSD